MHPYTHLLVAVLVISLAACAPPALRPEALPRDDYEAVHAYIAALARQEMRRAGIAGLSVALVNDQQLVWADGYGFADRARKLPAGPDTVYRIGSITKLFTASAVMQLAEQGRLAIDRPVAALIPGFAMKSRFADAGPMTPRLLMSHHAGLPSDILQGFSRPQPVSLAELTRQLQDEHLAFAPGTVWSYSNVGYALLGRMIETASGMPYERYVEDALLKPLGMTGASVTAGAPHGPRVATGYRDGKEGDNDLVLRDVSAGGVNASVRDLGRFLSMIFAEGRAGGGRVLQPESVREMLRPQNTAVPLDLTFRVGLGWMLSGLDDIDFRNAGPVAHHSGATQLFYAQIIALPEHKLGVVVLSNTGSSVEVVNKVATETLRLALEAKTGIREPVRPPPTLADGPIPPTLVHEFVGDYATQIGHVRVYARGPGLRADVVDRTFRMVPREDGLLALRYKWLGLVDIDLGSLADVGLARRRVAGRDVVVAQAGADELLVGEKLEPVATPPAWLERIGDYEITNLGTDHPFFARLALTGDAGRLFLELAVTQAPNVEVALPLEALDNRTARVRGLGRGLGDVVVAIDTPDGPRLRYSGYLLQKTGAAATAAGGNRTGSGAVDMLAAEVD